MIVDSKDEGSSPRWGYLVLAGLILLLVWVTLASLWQLPQLLPLSAVDEATATAALTSTARPTALPATVVPSLNPSTDQSMVPGLQVTEGDRPLTATAIPATPSATVTSTPTPTLDRPIISGLQVTQDDRARSITFRAQARVPPDRRIEDVYLWYDTEVGQRVHHFTGRLPSGASLSYRLDVADEGLTTTKTYGELDYWWLVYDTAGDWSRTGGYLSLEPGLQTLASTSTPQPPDIDSTWPVSETRHYRLHYVPGTAAERDLSLLGSLAEGALACTRDALQVEFDGIMDVYFVPRLFWQGAATYGDKVQLISYLDRNYAAVETWSYFTHEGTHALAQDLIRDVEGPKEQRGGPDGVLVEGLAVWASDGHYRQEPIDAWASVVAASDDYIRLADLRAGPFYDFQHETSYLEAGSFVKFLVDKHGLATLKALYGLSTGDAERDGALVEQLYGRSYDELEEAWLEYLAGLAPTSDQVEAWHLTRRFFDLMRRYETELDPDARILPGSAPPEWTTDTLTIFTQRSSAPLNLALETALIASQDRLSDGDFDAAEALMNDVEAAVNAGGTVDRLGATGRHGMGATGVALALPSLQARLAILQLVAEQDRAVLRAQASDYLDTVAPESALALKHRVQERVQPPFVAYEQEIVRLDISDDGLGAHGEVLVHARLVAEVQPDAQGRKALLVPEPRWDRDNQLFAVTFVQDGQGWLMQSREPVEPALAPLPSIHSGESVAPSAPTPTRTGRDRGLDPRLDLLIQIHDLVCDHGPAMARGPGVRL